MWWFFYLLLQCDNLFIFFSNVTILPDNTRFPRRDCTHTFDSAVFSMAEFHHLKKQLKFRKCQNLWGFGADFLQVDPAWRGKVTGNAPWTAQWPRAPGFTHFLQTCKIIDPIFSNACIELTKGCQRKDLRFLCDFYFRKWINCWLLCTRQWLSWMHVTNWKGNQERREGGVGTAGRPCQLCLLWLREGSGREKMGIELFA